MEGLDLLDLERNWPEVYSSYKAIHTISEFSLTSPRFASPFHYLTSLNKQPKKNSRPDFHFPKQIKFHRKNSRNNNHSSQPTASGTTRKLRRFTKKFTANLPNPKNKNCKLNDLIRFVPGKTVVCKINCARFTKTSEPHQRARVVRPSSILEHDCSLQLQEKNWVLCNRAKLLQDQKMKCRRLIRGMQLLREEEEAWRVQLQRKFNKIVEKSEHDLQEVAARSQQRF